MKKIAIVLALMLVLSCFALVACGNKDESSAAESTESKAVEESKEESKDESVAESEEASEDESAEESSEAESEDESSEDESQTETPAAQGTNIAKGKKYTVTGCGTGYTNLGGQWPAKYDASVTDGVASDAIDFGVDSHWFAFYYNATAEASVINAPDGVGAITIDLGAKSDITAVRAHLGNNGGAGVCAPGKVSVLTSDDGKSFKKVADLTIKGDDSVVYWSEKNVTASARYVKYEFTAQSGNFMFLDELEVIGK